MNMYKVTAYIKAGGLAEAWKKVAYIPASLRPDDAEHALEGGVTAFSIENMVDDKEFVGWSSGEVVE